MPPRNWIYDRTNPSGAASGTTTNPPAPNLAAVSAVTLHYPTVGGLPKWNFSGTVTLPSTYAGIRFIHIRIQTAGSGIPGFEVLTIPAAKFGSAEFPLASLVLTYQTEDQSRDTVDWDYTAEYWVENADGVLTSSPPPPTAAVHVVGTAAPFGGGTAPAPPTITAGTSGTTFYNTPYGNLWKLGFIVNWTAPAGDYSLRIVKIAPAARNITGNPQQATIDTIQGPFSAGAHSITSEAVDSGQTANESWTIRLVPINADNLAGTVTDIPVAVTASAISTVAVAEVPASRTNINPDDPTAATQRGLMTSVKLTVTLSFNEGGTVWPQQVRAWMRYDRGSGGGTPLVETILLGSFGIMGVGGAGPNAGEFTIPSVWVSTAVMGPTTTPFKIICAIWQSDGMLPPAEVTGVNTGSYNMPGPALTVPPTNSGSVNLISYWTIPGGLAWGFHTIQVINVPFTNAEFKAIEFTVQKYPTTGLLSGVSPTPNDPEGIERTFGGSGASQTPYLNISIVGNTVLVTLLTAWTMPAKDSANRRFVIRVKNVRQDNTKSVVTCWPGNNLAGGGVAGPPCVYAGEPSEVTYCGDHMEIVPSQKAAELTATAFDPAKIGPGNYLDPTGKLVSNDAFNPSQMLPNPSFEDGTLGAMANGYMLSANNAAGATAVLVSSPFLTGQRSMQLNGNGARFRVSFAFTCRPGDAFYAEAMVQSTSGANGSFRLTIVFEDNAGTALAFPFADLLIVPGPTWTKVSITGQAPGIPQTSTNSTKVWLQFQTNGNSVGNWYVDNGLLRPIQSSDTIQHGGSIGADANGNLVVNTDGTTIGTAAGTVTVSGTTVTWVSGGQFSGTAGPPPTGMWGQSIVINAQTYTVVSVISRTQLTINTSLSYSTPVAYSIGSVVLIPAGAVNVENLFLGTLGNFLTAAGQQVYGTGSGKARPMAIVFGLPVPDATYPVGALIFNLQDGKVYRYAGGSVISITVNPSNLGTGYTPGQAQYSPTGGGGSGCKIQAQFNASGSLFLSSGGGGGGYSVGIIDQGQAYSSSFSYILPGTTGSSVTVTLNVGATGSAAAWIVAVQAQDVLAGTVAAATGYFGQLRAEQVIAGTFTGCLLDLIATGIRTTINNYADSNLASLLMGLKVTDQTSGNYSAVGPRRIAFRLGATGLNAAQLGADPDTGLGQFGGMLSLSAQHRSFNWSDGGGLQVIGPGGSGTGASATINYVRPGGTTGFMQFIDGILTSWS